MYDQKVKEHDICSMICLLSKWKSKTVHVQENELQNKQKLYQWKKINKKKEEGKEN